jgi:hypothetical protein
VSDIYDQAPVRVCCGQRHYGAQCLDGRAMCCICFEVKTKAELEPVSDSPGKVWDVCRECAEREKAQGATY